MPGAVTKSVTPCHPIAKLQILSLQISTLKPLHAGWLFHAFDFPTRQTDVLKHGWEKQHY